MRKPPKFIRATLGVLAASAVTVLLTLALAEGLMRAGFLTPSFKYLFDLGFRVRLDRTMLYTLVPLSAPDINSQGYRDTEFGPKRDGARRIVFLGDSFIMGMTTSSDKTIPNQLEALLGPDVEVLNMGVYGYGPDQSLMQLRREAPGLDPDMVILSLFPTNDYEDIRKNDVFTLSGSGGLEATGRNAVEAALPRSEALYLVDYLMYKYGLREGYFLELFTLLHRDSPDVDLYVTTRLSEGKKAMMGAVLAEFKRECEAMGIPLLVVVLPYGPIVSDIFYKNYDQFYNEQVTASILRGLGIGYIRMDEQLRSEGLWGRAYTTDPGGEHFNEMGHALVARAIARRIFTGGWPQPGH